MQYAYEKVKKREVSTKDIIYFIEFKLAISFLNFFSINGKSPSI